MGASPRPHGPVLTPQVVLHDRANLIVLPIMGCMVLAGLMGYIDTMLVTKAFVAYIVGDLVWLLVEPRAVPSRPKVIMAHHVATILLLQIPLKHPQLGRYTCMDGLIEWNTFFLIARRQFPRYYQTFNSMYWATFYPLRLVLFPLLLPLFWNEMRNGYAWWETAAVMGTQLSLVAFNCWFLIASWMRRR